MSSMAWLQLSLSQCTRHSVCRCLPYVPQFSSSGNRDHKADSYHTPKKSGQGHWYSNAFTTASGLVISKIGVVLNYLRFKLTMDNSEKGGSLKNIHAHYDLSNDVFTSFLDSATMMYSCAVYDAIKAPSTLSSGGLVFRGTLEEAQQRKVDTLLARAQIQPNMTVLDIGKLVVWLGRHEL